MKKVEEAPLKPKFHEEILRTSSLDEMRGKYLAEKLVRKWDENFADEDTGEVVTIERKELIFEKGTLLTSDVLTEVNFYLQSQDINEVAVSNQQRYGFVCAGFTSVWSVTVKMNSKKFTYLLYANSLDMALEVIVDYLEQELQGGFILHTIKELDYSNLIPEEEEAEEQDFYKIELEVEYEYQEPYESTYILRSKDAESAKKRIVEFIARKGHEENRNDAFEVTILSAKTISCYGIVDYKFSQEYFDRKNK